MKILFQGDSITDAFRKWHCYFGSGYATMVAGTLSFENPDKYEFVNRGIAGNRTVDLYERIEEDIINVKPDVMSLLIGVNDVYLGLSESRGVEAEQSEIIYNKIIDRVKTALPNIKIMILGSFLLPGEITNSYDFNYLLSEVKKRASIAKRIAEKNGFVFVPLQEKFDEMAARYGAEKLTGDGIHPTVTGHELIKREWLKGFEKLF